MKKYIYIGPEYTLVKETKDSAERIKVKQGETFESEIEYDKHSRFIVLEENYDPDTDTRFPFSKIDSEYDNIGKGKGDGTDSEDESEEDKANEEQTLTVNEIKAKLAELEVEIPKGVTKKAELLALLEKAEQATDEEEEEDSEDEGEEEEEGDEADGSEK